MNIIEAMKRGRAFYRKSWSDKSPITFDELGKLAYEAVIADDWEVEERSVTITSSQFDAAWEKACSSQAPAGHWLSWFRDFLKKELKL